MRIFKSPLGLHPLLLRIAFAFLLILLFSSTVASTLASAQTVGDFRTRDSGDWDDSNTWEEYVTIWWFQIWSNTGNWPNSNSGVVTIQNGHTVDANKRGNYDQIVVEAGGHLEVSQTFKVDDGPGTDLDVYGTLTAHKNVRVLNTSSAAFRSGSVTNIDSGDRLRFEANSTGTFESGSVVNVSGIFQPEDDAQVFINAGATISIDGRVLLRNRAQMFVSGTIDNMSDIDVTQNAIATFLDGSLYLHSRNGGAFPNVSNTIWSTGSEARIVGVTNSLPVELDASFYHLTWNSASQSTHLDLAGAPVSIQGRLKIESTNNRSLTWNSAGSDLTVGGDFEQSGGEFRFTETGSPAWTVSGNFNQTSGATYLAQTSGSPSLTVKGDFNVGSSLVQNGASIATISLNGASGQLITANATLSGKIDLALSGSSLKTLGADLYVPGAIVETSGGLNLASKSLELTGNLIVSSQMANPEQITFSGADAKQIQVPLASSTIPDLALDASGTSLSLASALTVSTIVSIRNGTLNLNGNSLTLPAGAVLYNNGTVSGDVTMSRYFGLNADGWRMIASPLSNVSLSSLNAAFWTQGGGWASQASGASNLHSFNFGSQDWTGYTGANTTFSAASPYILYGYKLDDVGASILPTTWTITGAVQTTSNLSLTYSGAASTSYNYVGNPLSTNIDWNAAYAASSNISSSYATWDPSLTTGGGTTGYKYYNAASGIGQAGRYIPPFTGFMVGATASNPSLQFITSEAASRSAANYYGKGNETAPHIQFVLEGEGLAEDETYLSFSADAVPGLDDFDVDRLNPLSLDFATIWIVNDSRRLAFDGRSMETGREVYDVVFATTQAGTYQLSASTFFEVPQGWNVTAIDLDSGQTYRLDQDEDILFSTRAKDVVTLKNKLSSIASPRFRIVVEDPSIAPEESFDSIAASKDVVLSQNYPNPFNPSTSIRFSLPNSSAVKLVIYDALGREIQTIVNESLGAGWHEVSWSANNLSSGMYFYRLSLGSQVITRSMMLLR